MFDRSLTIVVCLLIASMTLPMAVPATAQKETPAVSDPDEANPDEANVDVESEIFGEEITVNGQQQQRSLQDTTVSVAVVTGEQAERSAVIDLYGVLDGIANVNRGVGGKGFAIRGIDQRGFGSGSGLLLSVTVDGATLQNDQASLFGPFSIWDLEQIEVFRGPQSTQRGRNSLAGAIVLRSADPTYEPLIKARIAGGNLGSSRVSAAVNLPLVAQKMALRLSFDRDYTDGWVDNPTRGEDDYDSREALTMRAKLRFDPNPRLQGLLTLAFTDNRGGEDLINASRFAGDRFNFSDERAEEGSRHEIVTLELDYQLNETWQLESVSNFYGHDYVRIEDTDQTAITGNLLNRTADDRGVTQELRLRFGNDSETRGVLGVYYADLEDGSLSAATLPGAFFGLPDFFTITGTLREESTTENVAAFGEFDLRLGSRTTLTAGARYDREEKRTANEQAFTIDPPLVAIPSQPAEVIDADYDAFLPKLALTFEASQNLSTGISVQQGYRAGGRSIAFVSQQVSDFDPEVTTNYELFLRSTSRDETLRFNANIFYIDWQDQQVAVRTALDIDLDAITINAGRSRLFGLEAELVYQPSPTLRWYTNAGYVDTKFLDFVDGNQDFSGNEFPFAPPWSLTAGVNWQFAPSWSLAARATTQGSFFSDASNRRDLEVNDRTLVDAKLGYRWAPFSVHFFARNLLDEDYLLERQLDGVRSGEPRAVGLEVAVTF